MRAVALVAALAAAALTARAAVPNSQLIALKDLYYSCGGPYWTYTPGNAPWVMGTDPCSANWAGVWCDTITDSVLYVLGVGWVRPAAVCLRVRFAIHGLRCPSPLGIAPLQGPVPRGHEPDRLAAQHSGVSY